LDGDENVLLGKIDELRDDLLDIEVKMQDALKTAFSQFESKLKAHVSDMVERTSQFLGIECSEEVVDFSGKIKLHCLEVFDALNIYDENLQADLANNKITNDQYDAEMEAKETELGVELFAFLKVDNTEREEVQTLLSEVEEYVT